MKLYIVTFWFKGWTPDFVGIREWNLRDAKSTAADYICSIRQLRKLPASVEVTAVIEPLTEKKIRIIKENEESLRYAVLDSKFSRVKCWDILQRLERIVDDMEWTEKHGEDWETVFEY